MGEVAGLGGVYVIVQLLGRGVAGAGVNEDQLDLHALGDDALDVDRHAFSNLALQLLRRFLSQLGKTREIGGEFNEHAVAFHASDDPRNRLSGFKAAQIFLPRAKQFLEGDVDPAALGIDRLDGNRQILAAFQPISGAYCSNIIYRIQC